LHIIQTKIFRDCKNSIGGCYFVILLCGITRFRNYQS
jgi:hypothetical protein